MNECMSLSPTWMINIFAFWNHQIIKLFVTTKKKGEVVEAVVVDSQPTLDRALKTNGTSTFVYEKPANLLDPSQGSNEWKHGICSCCAHCSCCCFVNEILLFPFGGLAGYSSAVAASGIDPDHFFSNNASLKDGQCCRCCAIFCAICCEVVPCQSVAVRSIARLHVAHKYQIREDFVYSILCTCCCPLCSDCQVQNEILTQENLSYGCCQVLPR